MVHMGNALAGSLQTDLVRQGTSSEITPAYHGATVGPPVCGLAQLNVIGIVGDYSGFLVGHCYVGGPMVFP